MKDGKTPKENLATRALKCKTEIFGNSSVRGSLRRVKQAQTLMSLVADGRQGQLRPTVGPTHLSAQQLVEAWQSQEGSTGRTMPVSPKKSFQKLTLW